MIVLLLIPVLFCGVFEEAKDTAEDHATGIVIQNEGSVGKFSFQLGTEIG